MSQRPQRGRTRERGLTLVEIMIVIAIIGLIGSIVGFNLFKALGKAKTDTARTEIKQLRSMVTTYWSNTSEYPNGLEDLVSNPGVDGWAGPYIDGGMKALKDPWKVQYIYEASNGSPPFRIGSLGGDKGAGGVGENTDVWSDDGEDQF